MLSQRKKLIAGIKSLVRTPLMDLKDHITNLLVEMHINVFWKVNISK